jgi:hypothetical protein
VPQNGSGLRDRIDVGADIAPPLRGSDLRQDAVDPFLIETRDNLWSRGPARARVHNLVKRAAFSGSFGCHQD